MASSYEDVQTLLNRGIKLFKEKFDQHPTVAVCAPGRVNIIGDHVDYNGGFVLPMALPMVTVALAKENYMNICRVITDMKNGAANEANFVEFDIPSENRSLTASFPKWANYVKGVVACFHGTISGFDCVLVSSVPVGAGLSSSAALEVAMYTLLEQLMSSPAQSLKDKALACQKAEHTFANVPCGIMDQFISAMGKEGHALLIDCKLMETTLVPLTDDSICILITDSGVKHELTGSEYPLRRAQCEAVARILNKEFLRDVTREELEGNKDKMDCESYCRALHVVNETEYTLNFIKHLQNQSYIEAGQCMFQSHQSLRDLYNVSCVELDSLVDIASNEPGIYGARMTGGGFGGCMVSLVDKSHVESAIHSIHQQCKERGIKPSFFICDPGDGARSLSVRL